MLSAAAVTAGGVAEHLTSMSVDVYTAEFTAEFMRLGAVRAVSPDVLIVSGITASAVPPAWWT